MPRRAVRVRAADAGVIADGVARIQSEFQLPTEFPPEVVAEAADAAGAPRLPTLERTDLPLVTIDPAGARDLDQAVGISRRGSGYRVDYAIADVAAFVTPGGPLDTEAQTRGETLYGPGCKIPLYPPELSEGAASLLPGQVRPALLWEIDLDSSGEGVRVEVRRALVRSRAQFDYEQVQHGIDDGSADEVFHLLQEVGRLRLRREAERGGVSLQLPEQEVVADGERWRLEYRDLLPVEQWNAQISLLTGMGCAQIMLYGEVGVLRTLPPPSHAGLARLRRTASALALPWPAETSYPAFVRSLDPNTAAGAAMLTACARTLRGAGYLVFDGGVPHDAEHAALACEYAHTTAPLRRLVDRYAGEVAVSLCADRAVPDWVRRRLPELPKTMAAADQRGSGFESAVVSLVEAAVLAGRVGESFSGVVTDVDSAAPTRGSVMVCDPAVEARLVSGDGRPLPLGERVTVRLCEADPARRVVRFELGSAQEPVSDP